MRRPTRREASKASRLYFTDGGRLYRFIDWVARSTDSMLAVVEDCETLEILIVRADELNAWREVEGARR